MATAILWVALVVYFGLGVIALLVLDILTGRVRGKLSGAAAETQSRMAQTGQYMSVHFATVLIVLALWLFWPVAVYGALTSGSDTGNETGGKNGT